MTIIGAAWFTLAEDGQKPGWHARRLYPEAVCDILAALLQPEQKPALLLEISAQAVTHVAEYPGSRGFIVFPEPVQPGPQGRVRLCLVLAETGYRDVFEVLAEDVAQTVANVRTEEEAVRSFLVRLHVWQRFMQKYGTGGLSPEAQTGLLGELAFLETQLFGKLSVWDAVEAWQGPVGGIQDFILAHCAIEVKSSTTSTAKIVEISNIAQLDETRVDNLLLCHILLHAGGVSDKTLPDVVNHLRNIIGNENIAALGRFNENLIEAGYLDIHSKLYTERRYRVRNIRFFKVEGDFPRIRVTDVRDGIISCNYSVRISACAPFEIYQDQTLLIMFGDIDDRGT